MERKKIALLFVCLNPQYWPFLRDVIEDAQAHFLKGHQVDFFAWTDIPEGTTYGSTVFPTDPVSWPFPTLMRYHLFLQQEEILKEYDYIFYLDADMRIVDDVGDEILGEGLTAAEHPMYALRREYIPPYEPNSSSTAYIPRPGGVVEEKGKDPWFKPVYAAGGFQGGTAKSFIEAMKSMKKSIDEDFMNNYTAIWNDESHWNRYLYDFKGSVTVLPPSYVYPDSLIKEYYNKIWGREYKPIIVTLTKTFTTTREAGDDLRERLSTL